jgi:excisionase family DNA binding protein
MSEHESTDPFLTVAEVATLLKLNQQTVRNWIDAGSLPAVRVGRRVRIPRSALDQLIQDGAQGSVPQPPPSGAPDASDFWGGEPVGGAEPDPGFHSDTDSGRPTNPSDGDSR